MLYNLPPLDKKLVLIQDTDVKLRFDWMSNYYKNKEFYAVHSGWRGKNPTGYAWNIGIQDMYGQSAVKIDSISSYIDLTVPKGTHIKVCKLALGKNSGTHHVNISIVKSHNKTTHWDWPSVYISLPVEDFEKLDLEEAK